MTLLTALHVFANTVWIGAIVCVGLLVAAAPAATEGQAAGIATAALQLYRRVATPAFLASFLLGTAQLLVSPAAYMRAHWMHGKLTAAIVVIALHHVLGAKARKVAAGSRQAGRSSAILTGATLTFAFATVTFAVLKGQLAP